MEYITPNDQYTRKTNSQDFFDLTIEEICDIGLVEYSKCSSADIFLLFEEFFFREDFEYIRTEMDYPCSPKHPKTKIYLVKLLRVYLKEKQRLLKIINQLNLYETYLVYINHHDNYLTAHDQRRLYESCERKENNRNCHLRIV